MSPSLGRRMQAWIRAEFGQRRPETDTAAQKLRQANLKKAAQHVERCTRPARVS